MPSTFACRHCSPVCDTEGMFADIEKDPRRILALSGLFALIGVISLVIVLFQVPANKQTFSDVFPEAGSPEEVLAAKHEVLEGLSAASEVDAEGRPTEAAKLKVLESLGAQ